jgi:hypothetical protein
VRPPDKRKPGLGTRAAADTKPNRPPNTIYQASDAEQLTLWAAAIPAHPLEPDEWDLRRTVNTMPRGRHSWWLYTESGQHQREYLMRQGRWAA